MKPQRKRLPFPYNLLQPKDFPPPPRLVADCDGGIKSMATKDLQNMRAKIKRELAIRKIEL